MEDHGQAGRGRDHLGDVALLRSERQHERALETRVLVDLMQERTSLEDLGGALPAQTSRDPRGARHRGGRDHREPQLPGIGGDTLA